MRKKGKLIVILLLCAWSGVPALAQQNPQQLFDRANTLLEKDSTRAALHFYQQLEEHDQHSGALFLNMGLSYMRLDSMGKAKYYFLKSRHFEETQSRASKALEYVETRFSRQSAVLPELPWQKAINWLSDGPGVTLIIGIGLILLNLGLFLILGRWFFYPTSKTMKRSAVAAAIAGGLIILLGFFVDYRQQRYSKAVMISNEARVLEQPKIQGTLINQAFEGYTFTVDHNSSDEQSGWSYIRMSNGQYGWIPTKEIMIL